MGSHTTRSRLRIGALTVMVFASSVLVTGMLAGFAGPVAASIVTPLAGLIGFTGVGAAMLVPMSIRNPAENQ